MRQLRPGGIVAFQELDITDYDGLRALMAAFRPRVQQFLDGAAVVVGAHVVA